MEVLKRYSEGEVHLIESHANAVRFLRENHPRGASIFTYSITGYPLAPIGARAREGSSKKKGNDR